MSLEYKKFKDGSYLHNCYLERREREPAKTLAHQHNDESVTVTLNGYAIIPLEKYLELTGQDDDDWLKRVEEADKQLHPEEDMPPTDYELEA